MAGTRAYSLTKEQKATIEQRAWKLRVEGWTQERIAAELEVSQMTVSRILATVEKRLAKAFEGEALQIKARQTAQLEELAFKALEQFERSCEDAEKRRTVSKRVSAKPASEESARDYCADVPDDLDNSGFVIEESVELTGQSGNPALLAQARGAWADIRTIWALDAPKRQELTGRDGAPIPLSIEQAIAKVYSDASSDSTDESTADESEE